VIGGGLIAKIPDLEMQPRIVSAVALLVLAAACLIPLIQAIDIVAQRTTPLKEMATSDKLARTRANVNALIESHYPPVINTVEKLYKEYQDATNILNDDAQPKAARDDAAKFLKSLQPSIREIIELCSTDHLQQKFDSLRSNIKGPLGIIAVALLAFLIFSHREDGSEKALPKPVFVKIAWSGEAEAALAKAGLDQSCYAKIRPQLVQIAERSGLRAVVIAVPDRELAGCNPVRVILTNENKLYPE